MSESLEDFIKEFREFVEEDRRWKEVFYQRLLLLEDRTDAQTNHQTLLRGHQGQTDEYIELVKTKILARLQKLEEA